MHNRHTGRLPIHGEAGDKASLYRDRYQVLLQRLSRDKYFSKPAFDTVVTEDGSCEVFVYAMLYLSIIDWFLFFKPYDSTPILQRISLYHFIHFVCLYFSFFHLDYFYTVSNWVHWTEMDYGGHFTVGGAPILLGGSYWSSSNWLIKCHILIMQCYFTTDGSLTLHSCEQSIKMIYIFSLSIKMGQP